MYPTIKFATKDPENFYRILRKRVNGYFKENGISKHANTQMYIKTAAMLAIYFVPYGLMLAQVFPAWVALLLYVVMGFGMAGIGFSIMHDANHGAYSSKKWVNAFWGYTLNLVGGSIFTWKIQHNVLHHSYTNIYEMDEDIEDKPFLRLSPHGKLKKHHRFQHIYATLLYGLATISWVLTKDFEQWKDYKENGMAEKNGFNLRKEMAILIVSRAVYYFYTLALPMMVGVPVGIVIGGFLLMHLVAGIYITVIFQLAHVVEGPEHFSPEPTGDMENTWAIHQLKTTADFAPRNRFITWYVGGLNFQIEHHLFPGICHIHYPKIYKFVKQTAEECGLPYHQYPKLGQAIASHYRTLKEFGNQEQEVEKDNEKKEPALV